MKRPLIAVGDQPAESAGGRMGQHEEACGIGSKGNGIVKRSATTLENVLLVWRRWRELRLKGAERKRVGGVTEVGEERFPSLVQDASGILLVTNDDGIVSYVSAAIELVLGYRPEDVVGKDTLILVHPDDVGRIRDAMAEALGKPGTPSSMELRLGRRDGSWRQVESSVTSRLEDPAVGGLVFDSREVTERKRVDEARARLARQAELRAAPYEKRCSGVPRP